MEKVELQNLYFFAKMTKALDTLATRHIILRASGFGLRASGFGLRASGFGLRASGFGL